MDDDNPPPLPHDMPDSDGFGTDVAHLLAALRASVDAERGYWLARLRYARAQAKWIAVFAIAGIAAFVGAVMALIFGMLLILTQLIGPGLATLAVTIGFILVAAASGWAAMVRARRLTFAEADKS